MTLNILYLDPYHSIKIILKTFQEVKKKKEKRKQQNIEKKNNRKSEDFIMTLGLSNGNNADCYNKSLHNE